MGPVPHHLLILWWGANSLTSVLVLQALWKVLLLLMLLQLSLSELSGYSGSNTITLLPLHLVGCWQSG